MIFIFIKKRLVLFKLDIRSYFLAELVHSSWLVQPGFNATNFYIEFLLYSFKMLFWCVWDCCDYVQVSTWFTSLDKLFLLYNFIHFLQHSSTTAWCYLHHAWQWNCVLMVWKPVFDSSCHLGQKDQLLHEGVLLEQELVSAPSPSMVM